MKKFFILIIHLLFISVISVLQAQAPNLQKQLSLGGSQNDFAFDIHQTPDSGYIVSGQTATGGYSDEDFWIAKLNKNLTTKWQKVFGGIGDEKAFSIQQTKDGGYIAAGQAGSSSGDVTGNHGLTDVWVVKLDVNGNLLWQKSLGGSNRDFANSIQQTKDGGYIVAGGSFSNDGNLTLHHGYNIYADYWVIKLNAGGNIQWQRSYGGSLGDIAMCVRQTKDGGYIVAGNSASADGDVKNVHDSVYGDFWILKLSAQGNIQWQKAFGGSDYEQANSIEQTLDGGYVAAGWTRSPNDGDVSGNHGNYDFWVVKMNATGNKQWQRSLGGSEGDIGYSIKQTPDSGYVVTGNAFSNNGNVSGNHGKTDFWLVKINSKGKLLWQKALGGSEYENARSVDLTYDGGYVMAGSNGFVNVNNGDVTGNHGGYDIWITRLSKGGSIVADNIIADSESDHVAIDFKLSPNPAASYLSVSINAIPGSALLSINNSNGKRMLEKKLFKADHNQLLNVSAFPAGSYFVEITSGKEKLSKSFIKR